MSEQKKQKPSIPFFTRTSEKGEYKSIVVDERVSEELASVGITIEPGTVLYLNEYEPDGNRPTARVVYGGKAAEKKGSERAQTRKGAKQPAAGSDV